MSRWLAIVNPHAGAFRGGDFRATWMPRVNAAVATVIYTEAPGHATTIVRAAQGYDGIAVVGGDGTLFEVLAGTQHDGPPLAIIPAGRGNCLALDLNVGSVPRALQAIADGARVDVDMMVVEVAFADGRRGDYRAASTLAFGYVADTVARAGRLQRLGGYAYTAAAVCTRPRRAVVETSYGGETPSSQRLSGVVINNTRYLANFLAFPRASVSDGLIDVLELDVGWARQMLHNLAILSRSYFYNADRELQAAQMRFRLLEAGSLMIDGELLDGVAEFSVRCEPAAACFVRGRAA